MAAHAKQPPLLPPIAFSPFKHWLPRISNMLEVFNGLLNQHINRLQTGQYHNRQFWWDVDPSLADQSTAQPLDIDAHIQRSDE